MAVPEDIVFSFKGKEYIRTDYLKTFEFKSKDQYIKTETQEFIAVCPFSGLTDVARLIIEYYPRGEKCIELKSLKYYVTSFKDVGIYQEEATKKIYDDLSKVLNTDRIKITTVYNIRGGFLTTAVEGAL